MSTVLNTNGEQVQLPHIDNPGAFTCHIITADWNPAVTHALRDGAIATLREAGIPEQNIVSRSVPGTVELVNAAARTLHRSHPSAIIVIGCVIRGDTPHFDYVCEHTTQGVAILNALGDTPVIFGVLTVNDLQQALDRAGGSLGNKGSEAAVAALHAALF